MPEKTKPEEKKDKFEQKKNEEILIESQEDSWAQDQREKNYYYDDAHGYEIYNPEQDEDDE